MKRLECLDGLRGLLAAYVLLGHMAPFAAVPHGVAAILSHGGAAVDMFFMLSGLVILRSLESFRFQIRPFLVARVARIFPLYLVLLAAALCVQPLPIDYARLPWIGLDSPARNIWSQGWPAAWQVDLGLHLTMLHGLLPNAVLPGVWVSLLGSAWSLSTEWQFYVLAMFLTRRLGPRPVAALLVLMAVLGLAWQAGVPEPWRFSRAFLPNRAHFFALGVASAGLLDTNTRGIRDYLLVLGATLALCAAAARPEKLVPPLAWSLCLAAQAWPGQQMLRPLARVLCHKIPLRLGLWSYGIYLANEPIQKLIGLAAAQLAGGNSRLFTVIWVPAAIAVPVLAAAWLHRTIEAPALRAGRALAISRLAHTLPG